MASLKRTGVGAVGDDAVPLLVGSRQEARNVFQYEQRNIERVARTHETRRLVDALLSNTPARNAGWFATTPMLLPARRAKPQTMFSA